MHVWAIYVVIDRFTETIIYFRNAMVDPDSKSQNVVEP